MAGHGVGSQLDDRFVLKAPLGAGAMGVVYRAYDTELERDVALKMLGARDPDELYLLKQEFRVLADLNHPNLVRLHDLVVAPEQCFFTMELVEGGVDLVRWVRGEEASPGGEPAAGGWDRMRQLLPQLLAGLEALHATGRLHRDVKPKNVLVTPEGRAVLVDFGLALPRALTTAAAPDASERAGTWMYMAPELIVRGATSTASDYYALGVTLFEALTGGVPLPGDPLAAFERKRRGPAPAPSEIVPTTPPDLDGLVVALLHPDPGARPTHAQIRQRFAWGTPHRDALPPSTLALWEAPFVGREDALEALRGAFDEVRAGRPATVRVEGPSGIGKSALVRHFIQGAEQQRGAVALAGRCYPQESVPFKALDSLIDALSHHLHRLPTTEVAALVPEQVAPLLRVFPVLGRIAEITARAEAGVIPSEPDEIRRMAFVALRDLLARLARRRPLILWIDDLQWGDADSGVLLRTLADTASAPPLLLVLSYRALEWETSAVRPALSDERGGAFGQVLALEPLSSADGRRLAAIVATTAGTTAEHLDTIVQIAEGSPFLVCELARHYATQQPGDGARGERTVTIDAPLGIGAIVRDRLQRVDERARRLLSVVAVAGGPCSRAVASRAAGVGQGVSDIVTVLRNECLLRHSGEPDEIRLETYHDRIRECLLEALDRAERRALHLALAGAFEQEPGVDPLVLVQHYHGGGDDVRAAHTAVQAAERAYAALAFEQAANLYEFALGVGVDDLERWRLLRGRADALAQGGRGGEAGGAYRAAADALSAREPASPTVHALMRCAAEQFLRSGHIAEGTVTLRSVLRAVGERYPSSPRTALLSLAGNRLALLARGLRYRLRDEAAISPKRLRRIDALWAAAEGLVWADSIRSAAFQGRYSRLALAAGEPTRVVRALCTEAVFHALIGGNVGHRRAQRALAEARTLAERLDEPRALGLATVCAGGTAYFLGHFREGHAQSVRAEEILRTRCTGVAWELTNAHIFANWSLAHMGDLPTLRGVMPDLLRRARERGDLLAYCCLAGGIPTSMPLLADGDCEAARATVDEAVEQWPTDDFQVPSYFALVSATLVDLYGGAPVAAWRRIQTAWPTVASVRLLDFRLVRIELEQLRARCALAALAGLPPSDHPELLALVDRTVSRIEREQMPWAAPLAAALAASRAAVRGERAKVRDALQRAAVGFEAADMRLWAAAARHQTGDPAGGRTMAAQGVRDVDRYAETLIPLRTLTAARSAA